MSEEVHPIPDCSEMVSRVAEAIYEADLAGKSRFTGYLWKELAEAAIKAMREPTESMIEKGSDARRPGNSRWGNSRDTWKSMVDEAMK